MEIVVNMHNYFQELEITTFVPKNNANLNVSRGVNIQSGEQELAESFKNSEHVDLLILVEKLNNVELEQLLVKIVDSIKLVKGNLSCKIEYFCDLNRLPVLQEYTFAKILIFVSDQNENITNLLASNYNLDSNNLLITKNLADLNNNVVLKKQLWQDLKSFLV
jgi:DNA polymerase III psi subunit